MHNRYKKLNSNTILNESVLSREDILSRMDSKHENNRIEQTV